MFNKFILLAVFLFLIGLIAARFFQWHEINNNENNIPPPLVKIESSKEEPTYIISLFADSHLDLESLKDGVEISKERGANYLIHLGDMSDFGILSDLEATKKILEKSAIPYYVLPGDRDLYLSGEESVLEETEFGKIFGNRLCDSQLLDRLKILCLANSYNYNLLSDDYLNNFEKNLAVAKILVSAQPLYNPGSNLYMGFYSKDVEEQGRVLLEKIRSSSVKVLIAGDTHFFSFYSDEYDSELTYYTLGALTRERNIQQAGFILLEIYDNGRFDVERIIIHEVAGD